MIIHVELDARQFGHKTWGDVSHMAGKPFHREGEKRAIGTVLSAETASPFLKLMIEVDDNLAGLFGVPLSNFSLGGNP